MNRLINSYFASLKVYFSSSVVDFYRYIVTTGHLNCLTTIHSVCSVCIAFSFKIECLKREF